MSFHHRKEPAPSMRFLSCDSLEEALSALRDEKKATETSTLLIRQEESSQSAVLEEVLEVLRKRKNPLPETILRLRLAILGAKARKEDGVVAETDDKMSSSAHVSNGSLTSLRRLEISNCQLEGRNLQRLAEYLSGNASLSVLSLKACEIQVRGRGQTCVMRACY
jgi:hypothetical protein